MRRTVAAAVAIACMCGAVGCGPATFVSAEPPPDTKAEAWLTSSTAKVTTALRQAMSENGLAPEHGGETGVVVGTKQQLPYVDEESGGPTSGPLPVYRVRATVSREGETHVRVILHADCPACDGTTPYEWEYPGDVIRSVLDRTRKILKERRARFVYPPRHRPVRWSRPPRR